MTDVLDVVAARATADAAQRVLEQYLEPIAAGAPVTKPELIPGLAGLALCERLNALTVQLGHASSLAAAGTVAVCERLDALTVQLAEVANARQ